jgi:hypothetical protein
MKKILYNSSLNKLTVKLFFTMALLTSVFVNAQTPFENEDVIDVPGAPVDDWILPFALLSLISGYFYFRKRTTIFNS